MNIQLTQILPDNTLYWNVVVADNIVTTMWHSTRSPNLKTHQVTHPSPQKALTDAASLVTKKKRAGYREKGEAQSKKLKPMLAQKYKDQTNIPWPMYIQKKYNGIRGIWDGYDGVLYSRKGKVYPCLPDLQAMLMQLYPNIRLDGELIVDGLKVNEINSIVSRTVEIHPMQKLVYYVAYDLPDSKAVYRDRMLQLYQLKYNKKMVKAPAALVFSAGEATSLIEKWITNGEEGGILRDPNGKYKHGKRAKELLKYKLEDDDEFDCVDVSLDKDGFPILHFLADNGKPFTAVVEGSHHYKASLAERMASLVGTNCKVAFAEYTIYGVPFHGRVVFIEEQQTK